MSDLINTGQQCPYCGNKTEFIDSSAVYGTSYGMIYRCPPCNAWVGVHKGTNKALGQLANPELREWKKKAHALFDPLWMKKMRSGCSKKKARGAAYKWLSQQMGIPVDQTHIGMFDVTQCQQVVELCKPFYKI